MFTVGVSVVAVLHCADVYFVVFSVFCLNESYSSFEISVSILSSF